MSSSKELVEIEKVSVERVANARGAAVHLELSNGTVCIVTAEERSGKYEKRLCELIRACQRVLDATTEDA